MAANIAKWMNLLVLLLTAAFFIKTYYTPSMSFFYKKKWVIVLSSILILCTVIQVIDALITTDANRVPTKEELRSKITAKNTLVDQDFVYNSVDGYSLVVPAGYAYTTFPSGAISMTAFKNLAPSIQSGITISRRQVSEELENIMAETMKVLKSGNSTYSFHAIQKFSISNKNAFKSSVEVVKEGVPINGIFIFTKSGNNFLLATLACPTSHFQKESLVFEKVIQSLTLR
jgi:hypothetical protein